MKPFIAITLAATLALAAALPVPADEKEAFESSAWGTHARPGVAPVRNRLYREECGSCHMAYPPGLLPAQSWERIMTSLDDHFGENAELPERDRVRILNYLLDYAAGRADYRVSNRVMWDLKGQQPPLRITELPYFRREHHELSPRMVRKNPKVRSFSNCDLCHVRADKGSFDEHEVYIPGYGRYDD
ncbi:MAG TPA: cytochrome C [Thiotrichales bacterium]|nr:cytochrome C [Thiotrichales bacterium]